jgi:hypothetical protein
MSQICKEFAHRAIERVARESYGRLVAYLSVNTHDLAAAEDALSEALLKALTAWPRDGVPQGPEASLLTTARHSVIDVARHQRVVSASEPTLQLMKENTMEITLSTHFPDERLKLLFVCAHPAIDPNMHTPSCCRLFWAWMRHALPEPFLLHRRRWGDAWCARRQRSAMAVSSSRFRTSVICRNGLMLYWRRFTRPLVLVGTIWWELTKGKGSG